MAFTYTAGSTADRNRLRLLIGDTDATRKLFEDEELDDILTQEGDSINGSAALACETLAIRFARDFDFTADGATFRKSKVSEQFEKMARKFRSRARGSTVVPARPTDGYSDDIDSDDVDLRWWQNKGIS
jgi:hypothetical protein